MLTTASKVAIGLGVPVGIYAIILGTLMTPYFQRLYDPECQYQLILVC
jgi:hypothetical protein